MKKTPSTVRQYIAAAPKPAQTMLTQLRRAIRAAAPAAKEKISYGIPFYEYRSPGYLGRLVYFGAFTKHVSIFAWGREVEKHRALKKYKTSTGTLQFPIGSKIPLRLVKTVVRARMKEIDGSLAAKAKQRRRLGARSVLVSAVFMLAVSSGSVFSVDPPSGPANEQRPPSTVSIAAVDLTPPAAITDLRTDGGMNGVPPPCSPIVLVPTIHAMGVINPSPLPGTDHATIRYRKTATGLWTDGHDAVSVNTGKIVGSIFWLDPNTPYDVEVRVRATDGSVAAVHQCTATTQPDVLSSTVGQTWHVSAAAAPNGNGSAAAPLVTIQAAINLAQPGDEISVGAGVYHEGLTFPRSGTAGAYIKLIGQPGAILDGGDVTIEQNGLSWTPDGTYPSVYQATLPVGFYQSAVLASDPIWRDGDHYYAYSSLANLQTGTGQGNVPIAEGWFYDHATRTLSVRSSTQPSTHTWHIRTQAFGILLRQREYLWIEGLNVRYFPIGIYLNSAAHSVIRRNTVQTELGVLIDNAQGPVSIGNRIEQNTLADPPLADWGYFAVKATPMEAGAIVAWASTGSIIRDNRIEQHHNGIFTGDSIESDVYRNVIRHLSDDGLELDGNAENIRTWGNAVDDVNSGLSLAPTTIGPVWSLNNRLTQYAGRAFKIGGGVNGAIFLYHNTVWTNLPNAAGTQQVTNDTNRIVFRNNILRAADLAIRWTVPMPGVDMDYDNAFSPHPTAPYYWNAVYQTLAAICAVEGDECNGSQAEPQLIDPSNGSFGLAAGSPNIDAAVRLPGINDTYFGAAPDRGYVEIGQTEITW